MRCGDQCVDVTTSLTHCGGCDRPCAAEGAVAVCSPVEGGTCLRCNPGESLCGATCIDLKTAPAHCGACGHSCLGGACTEGRCGPVDLGTDLGRPSQIALTSESVYWNDKTASAFLAYTRKDGPPCRGASPGCSASLKFPDRPDIRRPTRLATDGTGLFALYDSDILRWSLSLEGPTPFAVEDRPVRDLLAHGPRLVWSVSTFGAAPGNDTCFLLAADLGNGHERCLASAAYRGVEAGALATGGDLLYFTITVGAPETPRGVYALNPRSLCQGAGCRPLHIVPGPDAYDAASPNGLTVAGDWVYWSTSELALYAMKTDGTCGEGPCPRVLATRATANLSQDVRLPLVADATHLYWGDVHGIHRVALDTPCSCTNDDSLGCVGGSCETLLADRRVEALAQDEQALYATVATNFVGLDAKVVKLAKPKVSGNLVGASKSP